MEMSFQTLQGGFAEEPTTPELLQKAQFAEKTHLPSHVISISLPSSPAKFAEDKQAKKVLFTPEKNADEQENRRREPTGVSRMAPKYYSEPLDREAFCAASKGSDDAQNISNGLGRGTRNRSGDENYGFFKTKSGKLIDRQLSRFRPRRHEKPDETEAARDRQMESVPTKRYYDAFKGPELETLRESEELILPKDQTWPFLLRFPISSFGISLGVASQAILYKNLAVTPSMKFLHIPLVINFVLWCIGLLALSVVFACYMLKCINYFEAVRREYYHPVRVNFFFAPWVACMFLAIGLPPRVSETVHPAVWCVFMFPVFCLELKIYGQWMSGGQRRLSKVANPSNHLAIVGNFVGALLGAITGWKEGAIFFFAVGLAHYIVVFVTLYQRLPTNETLPNDLHPVFFLFVAAPSVASVAWEKISGDFGYVSRVAYFIALFLYSSLVVRINFFRGFSFNISWWAYTFPMTAAAVATIRYSNEVPHPITRSLAVLLSLVSSVTVSSLLVTTLYKAFVKGTLFQNDAVIAISNKKHKNEKDDFTFEKHKGTVTLASERT